MNIVAANLDRQCRPAKDAAQPSVAGRVEKDLQKNGTGDNRHDSGRAGIAKSDPSGSRMSCAIEALERDKPANSSFASQPALADHP